MRCQIERTVPVTSPKKKAGYPTPWKEKQIVTTFYMVTWMLQGSSISIMVVVTPFNIFPSWTELSFWFFLLGHCGGLELCQALLSIFSGPYTSTPVLGKNFTFFGVWFSAFNLDLNICFGYITRRRWMLYSPLCSIAVIHYSPQGQPHGSFLLLPFVLSEIGISLDWFFS